MAAGARGRCCRRCSTGFARYFEPAGFRARSTASASCERRARRHAALARPVFSGPVQRLPDGRIRHAHGSPRVALRWAVHPLSFASPRTSCCRDVTSRLRFPVGGSRACRSMSAPFIAPSPRACACTRRERCSHVVRDEFAVRRRARAERLAPTRPNARAPERAGSTRHARRASPSSSAAGITAAMPSARARPRHAEIRCAPTWVTPFTVATRVATSAMMRAALNSRCVCADVLGVIARCRSSRFVVHNRSPSGYLGMWGVTGSETISRKESGGLHAASS